MLKRTFIHIAGVGRDTERKLWEQGCVTWETFLENPNEFSVGSASREIVISTLEDSMQALEEENHQFFQKALTTTEVWRAWPDFRSSCAYLDIETDGGMSGSSVTTVGIYDGNEFKCLIKDRDLKDFQDVMSHYSYIVTFYGTGFDLPMLRKFCRTWEPDQMHLDLCFALKRLGIRGGLKKIEKQFGIARVDEAEGLDGSDAIRLWREYRMGNDKSLDTLIAYNREDVVNLERLAQIAYDKLCVDAKFPTGLFA
jgi:uncharacterized protein